MKRTMRRNNSFLLNGIFRGQAAADTLIKHLRQLMINRSKNNCPCLGVLMIGNNKNSSYFVRKKQILAADLGIRTEVVSMTEDASLKSVLQLINSWNKDCLVHGIMVQLPVPFHLNLEIIRSNIALTKDVDGMHPYNFAVSAFNGNIITRDKLATHIQSLANVKSVTQNKFQGSKSDVKSLLNNSYSQQYNQLWWHEDLHKRRLIFIPAVVKAVMLVIQNLLLDQDLLGKQVLIINDTFLIGRPLSQLLLNVGCTVTVANIYTQNLNKQIAKADIVITATGKPDLVDLSWTTKDAIVIDVGSSYRHGSVTGDVKYDDKHIELEDRILTPVPGGVGPLTVAVLMYNVIMAYRQQIEKRCHSNHRYIQNHQTNKHMDAQIINQYYIINHDFTLKAVE